MAFLMLFPAQRKASPTEAQAFCAEYFLGGIAGKNVSELTPFINPLTIDFMA
jgi:hypothetical protein